MEYLLGAIAGAGGFLIGMIWWGLSQKPWRRTDGSEG